MANQQLTYLFAQLLIGISMFGHGFVRVFDLVAFAEKMTKGFEDTLLPEALVHPFMIALPILELAVGLLLLVGAKTKWATIAGLVIMLALIFGSSMQQNWSTVPVQLFHGLFLLVILLFLPYNKYSLDGKHSQDSHQ
ncbi:MauE/DoxX family redox-associated membrane protein [Sphingobacterium spiritivorum]|nr:MauE/DoxX family redox-associated membrane protein [Sphingobacterium spiritivorum]QQS96354.1 DoxX family membrane protein [Sphingobacterium spiritivorum]